MIDDHVVLVAERLRDDLSELKGSIRKRYPNRDRQVVAEDLKTAAARLAETWMVELSHRPEVAAAIGSDRLADLNVQFQRLLTFSEHATKRVRYEATIKTILDQYTLRVCHFPRA